MDHDNKLTIVLLLKDRIQFTQRWMSYAEKIQLPFKILIADGSSDDRAKDLLSDKAVFPNVDYEYLRYPYDKTLPHFYNKTVDILSKVTTPYALLASNDDFLFIEGLRSAIAFLEDNSDYISARGEIYDFSIRQTDFEQHMQYVFGPLVIEKMQPYFKQASIASNNPFCRLQQQLRCNADTFHNVHRTMYLQKRFQLIKNLDPKDIRFADQFANMLTAAEGKIHRGKGLFMLYQHNASEREGQKIADRYPNLSEWMQSPSWQSDFRNLTEVVVNIVVKNGSISAENARKRFKQYYFEYYVGRLLNDAKRINLPISLKKMLKWVARIRKSRRFYKSLYFFHRVLSAPNDYMRLRSSKYFDEIKYISDFVSAK